MSDLTRSVSAVFWGIGTWATLIGFAVASAVLLDLLEWSRNDPWLRLLLFGGAICWVGFPQLLSPSSSGPLFDAPKSVPVITPTSLAEIGLFDLSCWAALDGQVVPKSLETSAASQWYTSLPNWTNSPKPAKRPP